MVRINKVRRVLSYLSLLSMTLFVSAGNIVDSKYKKEVCSSIRQRRMSVKPIETSEDYNMVNYDFNSVKGENFNSENYKFNKKTKSGDISLANEMNNIDSNLYYVEGYNPFSNNSKTSVCNILGNDDRNYVYTEHDKYPCTTVGLMIVKYNDVLNVTYGIKENLSFRSTAFLVGPNVVATAGHNVFRKNNGLGFMFPSSVEFYFGCDKYSDVEKGSSYKWYAKAKIINIQKEYYLTQSKDYDWAAIQLDRDIGYEVGWNGKVANYYEANATVESYGYPDDKPYTMWSSVGKMTSHDDYSYYVDLDSTDGQSGSPYFVATSITNHLVCGIHSYDSSNYNGGIIINDFIFAYLNSYCLSSLPSDYLGLRIDSSSSNSWEIIVSNPLNYGVTVQYNSKLCFSDDAKNWTNLRDVKNVYLSKGGTYKATISENWLATSITFSYCAGGKQFISYAYNLNRQKLTMDCHYNYFSI